MSNCLRRFSGKEEVRGYVEEGSSIPLSFPHARRYEGPLSPDFRSHPGMRRIRPHYRRPRQTGASRTPRKISFPGKLPARRGPQGRGSEELRQVSAGPTENVLYQDLAHSRHPVVPAQIGKDDFPIQTPKPLPER